MLAAAFHDLGIVDIVDEIKQCLDACQEEHRQSETALFLVFFLVFLVHLLLADGFAVDPETKEVYMQPYKYFMNLVSITKCLRLRFTISASSILLMK